MTLDPALSWLLRVALSLLFARAAAHKLADPGHFLASVAGYGVPPPWHVPAGALLIAAESGIAAGLWLPAVAPWAALAGAALLVLYGAAMARALAAGRRDLDCGCSGPSQRQPIRPALLGRNALLAAAALAAAWPAGARPLVWLDALTVAAGSAVLACGYLAVEGLLAAAARRGVETVDA